MRSSLFWDVTQRRFVLSYRRLGKTNRFHFQRSSIPKRKRPWFVKKRRPTKCKFCRRSKKVFIWQMLWEVGYPPPILVILEDGDIVFLHTVNRRKYKWIGPILRRKCLIKHVIEGKIEGRIEVRGEEEEDVCSYLVTLRKREDTGNWKRKH